MRKQARPTGEDSLNRIPFHPGSFTQSSCLAGLLPSGHFPSGCHFINRFSTVSYLAVSYVSYLAGLSNLPGLLPSGFLTYRGISFTRSFSSVTRLIQPGSSFDRAAQSPQSPGLFFLQRPPYPRGYKRY
uniref:Uncharacterized protein n=1 Tax=Picea glauca TaxID=3330 RepID=A0A117NGJ9_PICGL|nr:hypothetical protein ABT39_MTgene6322 [Picea glauca]